MTSKHGRIPANAKEAMAWVAEDIKNFLHQEFLSPTVTIRAICYDLKDHPGGKKQVLSYTHIGYSDNQEVMYAFCRELRERIGKSNFMVLVEYLHMASPCYESLAETARQMFGSENQKSRAKRVVDYSLQQAAWMRYPDVMYQDRREQMGLKKVQNQEREKSA